MICNELGLIQMSGRIKLNNNENGYLTNANKPLRDIPQNCYDMADSENPLVICEDTEVTEIGRKNSLTISEIMETESAEKVICTDIQDAASVRPIASSENEQILNNDTNAVDASDSNHQPLTNGELSKDGSQECRVPKLRLRSILEMGNALSPASTNPSAVENSIQDNEPIVLSESDGETPAREDLEEPDANLVSEQSVQGDLTDTTFASGLVVTETVGLNKKNIEESMYTPLKLVELTEQECLQCNKTSPCSIGLELEGTMYYLCSSHCKTENRLAQKASLARMNITSNMMIPPKVYEAKAERICGNCKGIVQPSSNAVLSWETMEFCDDNCLKTCQDKLGKKCCNCGNLCADQILGKYSVLFGSDIRQFCQALCLEEFKKNLRVCSYCQENISNYELRVTVHNNKISRDFCNDSCLANYERVHSNCSVRLNAASCAVCSKLKLVIIEVIIEPKLFSLCSEVCFSAFKFVHPFETGFCDLCKRYFDYKAQPTPVTIFHEDRSHLFCSKTCLNVFVILNRKIVQCNWCKVKKYNFDMIKKSFGFKQVMMFCSFHCYCLNKVSPKRNTCDNCSTFNHIICHLGMSDGTLRSFCAYSCLMKYRAQFKKLPATPLEARPVSQTLIDPSAFAIDPRSVLTPSGPVPKPNEPSQIVKSSVPELKSLNLPVHVMPAISGTGEPRTVALPLSSTSVPSTVLVATSPAQAGALPSKDAASTACFYTVFVPRKRPKMCNKEVMFISRGANVRNKGISCSPIFNEKSTQTSDTPEEDGDAVVDNNTDEATEPESIGGFNATFIVSSGSNKRQNSDVIMPDNEEGNGVPAKRRRQEESSDGNNARGSSSNSSGVSGGGTGNSSSGAVGSGGSGGDEPPSPNQNNGSPPSPPTPPSPKRKYLKMEFGVNAWRKWVSNRAPSTSEGATAVTIDRDPLSVPSETLGPALAEFVTSLSSPPSSYQPDAILYLCLGIQDYLRSAGRSVDIFSNPEFEVFTDAFHSVAKSTQPDPTSELLGPRIEEEHLWEVSQLGPHSPWTLLISLIFFNTKYFLLDTVEGHKSLCKSHIVKFWKKDNNSNSKTSILKYYPPNSTNSTLNDCSVGSADENNRTPLQQVESPDDPIRCPVGLHKFYLSKCDGGKVRGDAFYLTPEKNVISSSPIWFTNEPLSTEAIEKIFTRLSFIKEISLVLNRHE